MERRDIPMNEVVETIYQWHKGTKVQHISLSLGLDRKTVRKYVGMARSVTLPGAARVKKKLPKKIFIPRLVANGSVL